MKLRAVFLSATKDLTNAILVLPLKNNRPCLAIEPACRRHGILRPENEVLRLDMFNSTRHSERTAVSGEAKNLKL